MRFCANCAKSCYKEHEEMNKNTHEQISRKTKEIENDIINIRRHLHMYPELPGEEKETSRLLPETCCIGNGSRPCWWLVVLSA